MMTLFAVYLFIGRNDAANVVYGLVDGDPGFTS